MVDVTSRWSILIACHNLVEDTARSVVALLQKGVHFAIVEDIIHHLVQNVLENSLVLTRFNWVSILGLTKKDKD